MATIYSWIENGFNKNNFEVAMKLNELCSSIIVGINKFNDAKAENLVEASLLTGQSLNDNGFLNVNTDTTKAVFVDQDLIEKKKLKAGDIVFLSKGTNLRAAIVTPEQEQLNLLAPATCLVIKVNSTTVLPEFLTVFLNSEYGQAVLTSLNKGTVIMNIPVSGLKDIEINLPDLSKQEIIAQAFYQHHQALMLLEEMKKAHLKVMEATIQKLIA
ncbi:restriction endonuclease subunit S [Acinetobacter towneri]|uniref:restriction endonuclease subunit S n=1 Tax=Acinetobacter towneri TaxID=202956 RepID=UPI001CE1B657|nr:restriction endonuclease subunit S [Acinetobacter towneri]MCA4789740.1 restriction endonuclease subunit S [Acinetobacter towneri]